MEKPVTAEQIDLIKCASLKALLFTLCPILFGWLIYTIGKLIGWWF